MDIIVHMNLIEKIEIEEVRNHIIHNMMEISRNKISITVKNIHIKMTIRKGINYLLKTNKANYIRINMIKNTMITTIKEVKVTLMIKIK